MRGDAGRVHGRWVILAVSLFVGVGALEGGISLLADARGFGMDESWLRGGPFPDYTVPGVMLMVVIGGGAFALAGLAGRGHPGTGRAAVVMGITLLVWLVGETLVIGFRGAWQLVMVLLIGVCAGVLIRLGTGAGDRIRRAPVPDG